MAAGDTRPITGPHSAGTVHAGIGSRGDLSLKYTVLGAPMVITVLISKLNIHSYEENSRMDDGPTSVAGSVANGAGHGHYEQRDLREREETGGLGGGRHRGLAAGRPLAR